MKTLLVSALRYGQTVVGPGYIYTNTIDSLVRRGQGDCVEAVEVCEAEADGERSGEESPVRTHVLRRKPLAKLQTWAAALGVIGPETRRLAVAIDRLARSFNMLVWFGSAYDPLTVALCRLRTARTIFHINDSIALYERVVNRSCMRRWIASAYERRLIQSRFSKIVYVSRDDYDFAARHYGAGKLALIPVAVKFDVTAQCARGKDGFNVIISGNMSYGPNIAAALYVIREVAPLVADVAIRIVGTSPSDEVIAAARTVRNVTVTGWVPSVAGELLCAGAMLVPIFDASGIKIKILEAMAVGLPVITTGHCIQSFPVSPPVVIANTPAEFAKSIRELARDDTLWLRMHSESRDFVRQHFCWDARTDKLLSLGEF